MEQNTCDDFWAFEETLKKMRKIDDNIIHALNTTIPTDSFANAQHAGDECKDLYQQLKKSYESRESTIKICINDALQSVRSLKEQRQHNENDQQLIKRLKKEQTKLRLMQNELNVEEVVKDRTLKVFNERCRFFYRPPNVNL